MPVGDSVGLIHLIASLIAVAAGSWVLIGQKGTQLHRRVGYVYAASMVVVIVTAFMIYRLFGRFGVFHITAVVSAVTLALGMVPVIFRKPRASWLTLHFGFMYWSVIGLYAAFAAEILTRIPQKPFFRMVGIATGAVMFAGALLFFYSKKRWEKLAKAYSSFDPAEQKASEN